MMNKPLKVENAPRTILRVEGLKKYFPIKKGVFLKTVGNVKAVDGVDFFIKEGETLGLVGESGCGKSTVGRCVIRLLEPTAGKINYLYRDTIKDLVQTDNEELKMIRRDIQVIFQDPYSSLDPRMSIRDIIAEPLVVQNIGTHKEQTKRVEELLEQVGLRPYQMNRYPHEFSGGQRQRIGIARALVLKPRLIICDEPVSALDVSVQAQILNLLEDLQKEMGLTYLFVAHDLSVVEHISDRVMVMYLGKIVEMSTTDNIYNMPQHPYTEALLAAVPGGNAKSKARFVLEGNVPNPADPPSGCNFHTRCRYAQEKCCKEEPKLVETNKNSGHFVACHFYKELSLVGYQQTRELEEETVV